MSLSTSNSESATRLYAADDGAAAQEPIVPAPIVASPQTSSPACAVAPLTPPGGDARHGRRRCWRTIRRDAAILIAIALVAEVILQIVAPEYGHNLYDRTHTGGALVTFNKDGCRGPDVPMAKAPGELRVLCLGDSMTFGTGIEFGDTWPAQLKERLQSSDGRPVSVMNAGLQGVSLADLTAAYDQKWSQWDPDVVCLLASGNMISLASIERTDAKLGPAGHVPAYGTNDRPLTALQRIEESAGAMQSRLCLPSWLSINSQRALYFMGVLDNEVLDPKEPFGAMLAHGWTQGGLSPDSAKQAWNLFGNDLIHLSQVASVHHARLIVAMAPSRFELSSSWSDNQKLVPLNRLTVDPTATMGNICQQINVTCIDLLTALKEGRQRIAQRTDRSPPLYILFDYTHLDRDGNGIVAQEMAHVMDGGTSR
jgi:lysophospholipase L1-like esterase